MQTDARPDLMVRLLEAMPAAAALATLLALVIGVTGGLTPELLAVVSLAAAMSGRLLVGRLRPVPLALDGLLVASALIVSGLPSPAAGAAATAGYLLAMRWLAYSVVRFLDV